MYNEINCQWSDTRTNNHTLAFYYFFLSFQITYNILGLTVFQGIYGLLTKSDDDSAMLHKYCITILREQVTSIGWHYGVVNV